MQEGSALIILLKQPPVNALSRSVVAELDAVLDRFDADPEAAILVISGADAIFSAGGDIREFASGEFEPAALNRLLRRIEDHPRTIIAAIAGVALGGGLELAMACHFRVAVEGAGFGMPEVKIGIVPGSLGTQRLPRLVGVGKALDLLLTGRTIRAQEALEIGLVDHLVQGDVIGAAQAWVREQLARNRTGRRTRKIELVPTSEGNQALEDARARIRKEKHPLPASLGIVDSVAIGVSEGFDAGEAAEARSFADSLRSSESTALRYLFFARREAARQPAQAGLAPIERLAVVGAGTMGAGIAVCAAAAGIQVTLTDASATALDAARQRCAAALDSYVRRGRMSPQQAAVVLDSIRTTAALGDIADADMVIEAVFEDFALKQQVLAKIASVVRPSAIVASNTSTLDIDQLASATPRPESVIGLHFFSPAHIMSLLEVVQGRLTDPGVLAAAMAFARRIGKTPVVSRVCYGFIGNRMAEAYMRETEFMLLEGATPAQIDSAAEDPALLGLAMGPCRMLDLAGIDVGARTVIEWRNSGNGPSDPAYRAVSRRLFELGRFGQKTGGGYYRYEGRTPIRDESVEALCEELAGTYGVARRRDHQPHEIVQRLLYPMVNEASRILEERIARRGSDVDVVWTEGYGFPAWRGGPLHEADRIGLKNIVGSMNSLAAKLGRTRYGYWSVSRLLATAAESGMKLSEWRSE
jgi:3-hydroxyacyl-CoA dehydrogenase